MGTFHSLNIPTIWKQMLLAQPVTGFQKMIYAASEPSKNHVIGMMQWETAFVTDVQLHAAPV
jgi:hypothetical protein